MERRTPNDFRADMDARNADGLNCSTHQRTSSNAEAVVAEAREALRALKQSWESWRKVGSALLIGRDAAKAEAGGKTEGKHFTAAFSRWLDQNNLNIEKTTRARLLALMDHIGDVERWLGILPDNKRTAINHPVTIYKHWQKSTIPVYNKSEKPPSLVAKLKESVAALSEENQRLKEANGGSTITARDTARDVVTVLRGMFSASKLVEIRALLGKAERKQHHTGANHHGHQDC
jgi:hypothetical protein